MLRAALLLAAAALAAAARAPPPPPTTARTPPPAPPTAPSIETLDEDARIFLFHNFLTPAEADHIKALAAPRLAGSTVVDNVSGDQAPSAVRTSTGTFIERGADEVVARVEARIARWTAIPVAHGEGLQVLRYGVGQTYDPHYDYFHDAVNVRNGGQRVATVLMYLADAASPAAGGETAFPNVARPSSPPSASPCAAGVLAARPVKGDAVLFHSLRLDGSLEPRSLHAACPVLAGEKWAAAKWLRVGRFAVGDEPVTPAPRVGEEEAAAGAAGSPACRDAHPACLQWAEAGECARNPGYMVGPRGACLAACGRCGV